MQKKQNSQFDGTSYTESMQSLFRENYQLPGLVRRFDSRERVVNSSTQPYDELFIWSMLLYSGSEKDVKLSKYFWSKSRYPIAVILVGIIAYRALLDENFVPDEMKDKMKKLIKEYEGLAIGIVKKCTETNHFITQDLFICEIDIFFNNTILELANKAEAIDLVSLGPFQQLLTDVWFDKIDPHISSWRLILPYFFLPSLLLPISIFRSDNIELTNLSDIDEKPSRINIKLKFFIKVLLFLDSLKFNE